MPAILSILAPLIPYVLGFFALLAVYFGIKQKGVQQEKAKQEKVQAKAVEQVKKNVAVAVAKDDAIDKKAVEAKNEVEQNTPTPSDVVPGKSFKF